MFTGIIHGQGTILAVQALGAESRLTVRALYALDNIQQGESIAVNGVCLTVERFAGREFTTYASAATLSSTNLGELRRGSAVNLERALAIGDRLCGHIVSGHVDCLAAVREIQPEGQSLRITLSFPADHALEIIPKGSITLDGVSLTVNNCDTASLCVNVIPETARVTTIGAWRLGSRINMETDIIGKYVCHILTPWKREESGKGESRVTERFLQEHGFM